MRNDSRREVTKSDVAAVLKEHVMQASSEAIDRALFGIRSHMLIGLGSTLAGERRWPLELARTQIRWAFAEIGA